MRRRQFIILVGSAAAAWSPLARAQQPMRRVGVLMAHLESDPEFQDYLGAFREGLQKLGWTEGRNVRIDVLGCARRRRRKTTIGKGTGRTRARPHSHAKHAPDCSNASANE